MRVPVSLFAPTLATQGKVHSSSLKARGEDALPSSAVVPGAKNANVVTVSHRKAVDRIRTAVLG